MADVDWLVLNTLVGAIEQFIDLQISSTCFGQFSAHPKERKIVVYSMWCKSPDCRRSEARDAALQASYPQQSGDLYHML